MKNEGGNRGIVWGAVEGLLIMLASATVMGWLIVIGTRHWPH